MFEKINIENIYTATHIDLTQQPYHGGSTLSSGALPKWDVLDNTFMIKRCSIDGYGNQLTDAVNEELVYRFCCALSIPAAGYRVVQIQYNDTETRRIIEAQAVITEIFDDLVHYRDVRRRLSLGENADEYLDFSEKFAVQPALNDLLFIDYVTNQNDRHAKNLGIVNNQMSPVFDSGACLFYDIFDSTLSDAHCDMIPKHKTFGKPLDELLAFALRYVHPGFSFPFDAHVIYTHFQNALTHVKHYYTPARLDFINKLVKGRINHVGHLLAQA